MTLAKIKTVAHLMAETEPSETTLETDFEKRAKMPIEQVAKEIFRALDLVHKWTLDVIAQKPGWLQGKYRLAILEEDIQREKALESTSQRTSSKSAGREHTEVLPTQSCSGEFPQSPNFDPHEQLLLHQILRKLTDLKNHDASQGETMREYKTSSDHRSTQFLTIANASKTFFQNARHASYQHNDTRLGETGETSEDDPDHTLLHSLRTYTSIR